MQYYIDDFLKIYFMLAVDIVVNKFLTVGST